MSTREKTCEERITGELTELEKDLAGVVSDYYEGGEDENGEDNFEKWNNYPLAVTTRQETKIELSWGGPSSFLSVIHEKSEILSVTYHFQDWFDGASRPVSQNSKVWEYCQTVIEAREEMSY